MPYDEAMARFGTDRPDLRFGLELVDLGDALRETEFKVFRSVLDGGGAIRGINAGRREMPRSELDGLISRAQELGAKGLVWAFREGEGWRSPTAKFLSEAELADLNERLGAEEGDLLLLVADKPPVANAVLGQLRLDLAERFGLIDPRTRTACVWIVDWPLMEWNEEEKRWDALHHPVHRARPASSTPTIPGAARAQAYDVVWNGQELGGGSIRIHDAEIQEAVFARPRDRRRGRREARFGFLLEALRYGAPPHGGIAYGLDRIVQRLCRRRDDPRRDRLPEDRLGLRPADRRPGPGRRAAAARARHRHPQAQTRRALRWACGTGFPAGGAGTRARADAGPRRRPQLRQLGGGARLRRRADRPRLAPGAGRGRDRGGPHLRLAARPLRPRRHLPPRPGRALERSRVAPLQPRRGRSWS